MTALTRTPQNTNYLQPSKFILSFDRIPSVQYFCQEANLPGVSMGKAAINTPLLDIYSPSNKLDYSAFNIAFTINEGATDWQELYNWFLSMATPTGLEERVRLSNIQSNRNSGSKAFSDATLTILSALNNPLIRVRFINTFPTSLSDLQFDTKASADDIITATASFNYDYFTFETA
jgi:hypothetical protein